MSKLDPALEKKHHKLQMILAEMESMVVSMSGGVDSVLLAKAAADTVGDNALAVTVVSPTLPRRELEEAIELAKKFSLNHRVVHTGEREEILFASNPVNRCYFCKQVLIKQLILIKEETNRKWICSGENVSDLSEDRPGFKAVQESAVRVPLQEAGLTKPEVRRLARFLGLPNWDRPASACLATRIPFGDKITLDKLAQVEAAEELLFELGFRQCRVRHHGPIARIEIETDQWQKLCTQAEFIASKFQQLGFQFITLDLEGYRRGRLLEAASFDRNGDQ